MARVPLVLVTALLLVGCTQASPQPPGTAQMKLGGTFNLPIQADPFEWDVTYAGSSTANIAALWLAYSNLLRYQTGEGTGYNQIVLEPNLAERWEISNDVKTFTFHLRKGVQFADIAPVNGREVTAADVKWSFEYGSRTGAFKDAKLPASQNQWIFEGLAGIDTPDPYTVVVRFQEGFAPFITYAATLHNPILPREIYQQDGHLKERVVGSGPFQLDTTASQKGSRWVFRKNPGYWETGKPYLDEVRFLVIADESATRAAYQARQIDAGEARGVRDVEELRKAVPDSVIKDYVRPPMRIWLNLHRPPLGDARIRKAISLAIDRDEFIKIIGGGKGEWALGDSDTWDLFTQEEIKSFVKYDPEEARRLVREAGFPNGLDIEMLHNPDGLEPYDEVLQSQLRKVGINIVLRNATSTEIASRRRARSYDMVTATGSTSRTDIDSRLFASAWPEGGNNYQGINDPALSAMLLAQRRESDPAKRRDIARQAVRYMNENQLTFATFRHPYYQYWHPYVRDYYPHVDIGIGLGSPRIVRVWVDR